MWNYHKWKFRNISATQIFREIKTRECDFTQNHVNDWNFFICSENDKKSGGESPARRKVKTKKSPKHSSSDQNSDSEAEEDSRAKATRPARGKAAAKKKANATKKKDAEEGELFTQFLANWKCQKLSFWPVFEFLRIDFRQLQLLELLLFRKIR